MSEFPDPYRPRRFFRIGSGNKIRIYRCPDPTKGPIAFRWKWMLVTPRYAVGFIRRKIAANTENGCDNNTENGRPIVSENHPISD